MTPTALFVYVLGMNTRVVVQTDLYLLMVNVLVCGLLLSCFYSDV